MYCLFYAIYLTALVYYVQAGDNHLAESETGYCIQTKNTSYIDATVKTKYCTKPCKIWNGEFRRSRNVEGMSIHGVIWNMKTKEGVRILERKSEKRGNPSYLSFCFSLYKQAGSKNKDGPVRKQRRDEHSGTERYTQREVPEVFLIL